MSDDGNDAVPEAEAEETPPAEPAEAAQAPPAEGEHATTLADLGVLDTLRLMIGMLVEQAWLNLGLHVPPGFTEPRLDLPQARLAIDTVDAVAGQLRPHVGEAEQRELDNLLATLRLNFVKKAE